MRTKAALAATTLVILALVFGWLVVASHAQQAPSGQPPRPSTPSVLPRPDFHFPGNVGRTYLDSDPPQFPQPVQAPKGAPNVVLILLDDAGFGQFSTFGGGVPSPTMDKLAAEGLRYNTFHTTALCSPTRAALITGRNHHSAASGVIGEAATGYDGYTTILPRSTGTVGEVLRQNGYMTAWIGKNHNTPVWEASAAGPFDRWANGLGFDYFYGFNGGDMNHWNPVLYENRNLVPASSDPNYYLTTDLSDHAIGWVRKVKSIAPDRPFLLYVAPGATHAPHQVPQDWIDKFKGKFDMGWDKYREETIERQKKLGVVPQNTKLTERVPGLPAWDSLEPDQKRLYARMMEVFAAYGAECDHEMGRIIDAVKQLPDADNTIFIYIAGDNGSSAEGGLEGPLHENLFFNGITERWQDNLKVIDELGGPKHFNHFPSAWAHAMDTPFQWTKQIASHFGGTRNPMIVSWPARIKDRGGLRQQFMHVIDVVPTLYEAAKITPPDVLDGVRQKPIEGVSLVYTFDDANAPTRHGTQYFELVGNRAIYKDGWMASTTPLRVPWVTIGYEPNPDDFKWELYNISEDFSQANNLVEKYPDKLKELQDAFDVEARKYNVYPLDSSFASRVDPAIRPSLTRGRSEFVYYPGMIRIPEGSAPDFKNKSWTIAAEITVPEGGANGVLATIGGRYGGWALLVQDSKPVFAYAFSNQPEHKFRVASDQPLTAGNHIVRVKFEYDGGGIGKAATATLLVDERQVAQGRIPQTIGVRVSLDETFDVGQDTGTPVMEEYEDKMPFRFTGTLTKFVAVLEPSRLTADEQRRLHEELAKAMAAVH